jgi:hypothetical protein
MRKFAFQEMEKLYMKEQHEAENFLRVGQGKVIL